MTNAERGDFDNLILLCPNHHTQVDDLEPSRFTVEILTEMKLNAMENVEPGRWDTHNLIDQAVIALQLAMARLGEPLPKVSMSPPTPGSTGRVIHDESRTDDSIARPDRATARLEAVELGMNQVLGYGVAVFTRALPGGSFEFEIDRDLSDTEREALNNLATERRTGFEIRTVGDTVWAFTPGQASSEQPE